MPELLEGRGLLGPKGARNVLSLGSQLHQGLVDRAHSGGLLEGSRKAGTVAAAPKGGWFELLCLLAF